MTTLDNVQQPNLALLCESCQKGPRVYPLQIKWQHGMIRYFCEECVQKCSECDSVFKSISSRNYCTRKNCERELCDHCMKIQKEANITCPNCGLEVLCNACYQNGKCGRCTVCVGCEKKTSKRSCNCCANENLTNVIYCDECVHGHCDVCPPREEPRCFHKDVFDSCIFNCSDCSKKICIDCTPLCVECSDAIAIRQCKDCFKGRHNDKPWTCGHCESVSCNVGYVCHTCDEFKWDIHCDICRQEDENTKTRICEKCFFDGATCGFCKKNFCKKHESMPDVCTNCISKEALNLKQFQQFLMVVNRKGLRKQSRRRIPDEILQNIFNFTRIKDSFSFDIYKETLRALKREEEIKQQKQTKRKETEATFDDYLPFPETKRRRVS